MISCNEFLAEFGNYLEGDLAPEMQKALEYHLAHCATCQVIVDSTSKTLTVVTESGKLDLSEALPDRIVKTIMERISHAAEGSERGPEG